MPELLGQLNALLERTQDRIEAGDLESALELEARCQALLDRIGGNVREHGLSESFKAALPSTQQAFERVLILLASAKLETRESLDDTRRERGKLGGYRSTQHGSRGSRDWTA